MISLPNRFLFLTFILIIFMYCSVSTGHALNTSIVRCPPHHKFALLQLKREFAFKRPNFTDDYFYGGPINETDGRPIVETDSYPKMKFWKEGKDCCEWDGVTCNMKTGQVISLDLSSSWLHGPLSSHSSLFTLLQLQQVSLAFNNFTFSQIPSSFAHLSRLTHLNLSYSFFSGHVPYEIASLSNLISLDLSSYYHYDNYEGRSLLYLSMTTLAKNMTKVRELHLGGVNLSSLLLPQSLANLSSLTSLSLRRCNLHGEFPQNIFQLSNIQVIDVSNNENLIGFLPNFHSSSKLKSLSLYSTRFSGTLPDSIGNLKSLNELNIWESNFSGTIPSSIGNLSQLVYLDLEGDNFNGQIPSTFGNLSQLEFLSLYGENLNGQIPSTLQNLAKLTDLWIMNTGLTGELPFWIGNFRRLHTLSIARNRFNGQIPSSIGNLSQLVQLDVEGDNFNGQLPSTLQNLAKLTSLYIVNTGISGELPFWLGNLRRLQILSIEGNRFNGQIPSSLGNLSQLSSLEIRGTSLSGSIPSSLFIAYSLTRILLYNNQFDGPLEIQNVSSSPLKYLSLSGNNLSGQIPLSVFKFPNLVELVLSSNNLSGTLNLDSIPKHSKLVYLGLSYNSNITITSSGTSSNLPKFYDLDFASCNIGKSFPEFLRSQDKLESLDISNNKIEGIIPNWFLNIGIETLSLLNLSHNSFIGWETTHYILPWKKLQFLDLRSNRLQASLVVPPLSIQYFFISENKLSGRIHPLFCNLSGLVVLDVSNNHLSGTIPPCLGSFSNDLKVLNLKRNNFHGKIPQLFLDGRNLMTLDLSHNQLQGKIPKLLIKCRALEVLNLGHNEISDTFPFWLQNLPELQVLVLCSNKFYGPIWHPQKFFGFLKLRIIDLSFNKFNGSLPSGYFRNWSAINTEIPSPNKSQLLYMEDTTHYRNSVTMMNKGFEMVFVKILTIFTAIDLSSNNFYGEIPSSIRDLPSLIVLNLSSNYFKGLIPPSLGNLKQLTSLDLSNNELSGRIPQQLASLTFLAHLDLSENQLTGPIPRGNLSGLIVLDLSNNHLSGTIPAFLGSVSNDLRVLSLKGNNFQGNIPQLFLDGSKLMTLDLSHNQLLGKIPELLIKCRALEVLNLGDNEISDTFPLWLQNLPELQVLVLCSNKFYGPIWHSHKFLGFLKLRIIDLSFNNFSGSLPSGYFRNWSAITEIPSPNKLELYMQNEYYQNSVTVMNKGIEMVFVKILTIFTAIDLSNNNFYGEIPNSIGDLPSLIVLNLSSNYFEGLTPSSLGNLKQLESLDLSNNKLFGRIPQQLASLTFLAYLDLSENQLTGPIPQGTQISTFPSSSFDGNVELCGLPLSKKCESTYEKPILEEELEPEPENGFGWKVVLMGYGCGFVIGVIGGHLVISKKPNWFLRIYGRKL